MSKVILVTGSNSGIGYELVKILAEKGHIVYLSGRNEKAVNEAQAKLKDERLSVKTVILDVTNPASITAAKEHIEKAEGKLDVLVNNAGIAKFDSPQNARTVDVSIVRETFEPNFFGLIQACTTFLPLLRKSTSTPVILNVSTDMASNTSQASPETAKPHLIAYNTSKAAANSYTIALAVETKADGIKVNAVTPGYTSTKLNLYGAGGKSVREGAETLVKWALLGEDGPTGRFIDEFGKETAW